MLAAVARPRRLFRNAAVLLARRATAVVDYGTSKGIRPSAGLGNALSIISLVTPVSFIGGHASFRHCIPNASRSSPPTAFVVPFGELLVFGNKGLTQGLGQTFRKVSPPYPLRHCATIS